ncbi:MAG TPA: 2-dehydropantoate 2-reductase [Microvirga sp.]|nr:2-dehydropantoate 2-reductase [Microvirga sp.]
MRIAVLGGGGAMGGLFGGWLADAGNDVTLIDVSAPAVEAINASGLTIEEKDGSRRHVKVGASSNPAGVGPVDLIVNFVKCYHTDSAIRSAMPMVGPDTAILSLQNGWGNAPRIAAVAGEERVLVGLTYHSATLVAPGHVKHPGLGMTFMGELDGQASPRLQRAVEAFKAAGFETTLSTSILNEVWKKLALNVCTLPTAALLRLHAHELVEHEGVMDTMRALLTEVVTVAGAQGIQLDFDERWEAITGLLRRAIGGKASMLQDVEARRRTEIDVINGAIVEAGRRHAIPTPYNDTMVWLVRSLEETFDTQAKAA